MLARIARDVGEAFFSERVGSLQRFFVCSRGCASCETERKPFRLEVGIDWIAIVMTEPLDFSPTVHDGAVSSDEDGPVIVPTESGRRSIAITGKFILLTFYAVYFTAANVANGAAIFFRIQERAKSVRAPMEKLNHSEPF